MKATALFALSVAGALIAACGPSPTPVGQITSPSTSPSASVAPSPSAGPISAPGVCYSTHRCLALATMRGSDSLVVRDITDFNHPRTVSNLGSTRAAGGYRELVMHFISATTLSYPLNGGIVTIPLSGSPKTAVAGTAKDAIDPIWSPDRSAVVYLTQRGSDETGEQKLDVHLLRAGTDRVVGTTPGLGGGDCQSIATCEIPNFLDVRLAFSPDGKFFSFVAEGFGSSFFYVWSSDGTQLQGDASHVVTMSTWSGQALYFRGESGVEVWRDGTGSKLLPGVAWIRPSASPAGAKVVYTVRGPGGWGHIYLVDTVSKEGRELKAQRTDAVFLTDRYIWYRGERACVAADYCGSNPATHPESGKTYIYDLQTGTEYASIITNIYDTWPHAA